MTLPPNISEYCLNREPQFFLQTRFWHDLFHNITTNVESISSHPESVA